MFSYEHPFSLCVGRETGADDPAALPLGALEVRRSYFDDTAITVERHGESFVTWPRTVSEVFAAIGRASFRVEVMAEPPPSSTSDPGPAVPSTIIWRARKEGV